MLIMNFFINYQKCVILKMVGRFSKKGINLKTNFIAVNVNVNITFAQFSSFSQSVHFITA